MKATLLVEILTEELPPKSLRGLSEAFATRLMTELGKAGLSSAKGGKTFATPRRLAVLIPEVEAAAPDRESELAAPFALTRAT